MKKGKVIHAADVMPFVCDSTYSSRMLLDDDVAGEKTININEGTLKGGSRTGGGVHEKSEVYYIVRGEAELHLDDDSYDVGPGSVGFIPGGVFHYLVNKSETEDFVLLTFWQDALDNEVYNIRKKVWGKSFRTLDEG
jgi:mannose-6-phosphate isomerase-like protein (cupin superfamily)